MPLVVQFGACSPLELSRAASIVQPYCAGIDLNCGCPQSWACHDGLGAALMHERGKVADMIKAVKRACGDGFSMSVKIRVHKDLRFAAISVRSFSSISWLELVYRLERGC
jgi:tRNA-dihydrouridine synthase 4